MNNASPPVDRRRLVPPELLRRQLVLSGGRTTMVTITPASVCGCGDADIRAGDLETTNGQVDGPDLLLNQNSGFCLTE
ncbi:hypothetical protein JOB18_002211 [Solea senegalensis]|uniref:Uncharacterized protein n=1 Tax=Solea senegalensis TaxID=28829 RepID=A0AAV6RFG3_SOLSE|nr:hypothetical protein JOB18_002211 [Solea senegalensis]